MDRLLSRIWEGRFQGRRGPEEIAIRLMEGKRPPAIAVADEASGAVAHDGREPGTEARGILQRAERAEGGEKAVLDGVFREFGIAARFSSDEQRGRAKADDERLEGRAVAALGGGDPRDIFPFASRHTD